MSKWLRRGFGHNNNNFDDASNLSDAQEHYPEPPQQRPDAATATDMSQAAVTTTQQHYPSPPPPPPPQSAMTAYGGVTSANGAMDAFDSNYHHDRMKSDPSHPHHYQETPPPPQYQHRSGGAGNGTSSSSRMRGSDYYHDGGRSYRSSRPSSSSQHADESADNPRRRRSRSSGRAQRSSSRLRRQQLLAQQQQPSTGDGGGAGSSSVAGSHPHYPYSSASPPRGATTAPPNGAAAPPQHHHHGGQYHPQQAPPPPQAPAPPPQYGSPTNHPNSAVTPSPPPTTEGTPASPPQPQQSRPNFSSQMSGTSNSNQSQSSSSHRRPAYLLHRDLVIGKGSYGQVCIASRGEAEGHSSGAGGSRSGKRKKFACKCVVLRNDPKYIAKLQEEVNVLRELRGHENVIRLYDVFCVDNELFIITELGRGGDLFHLLTTHPKHGVTEAYAAKTVAQMLSAVAFLHSRRICHRDLKLENWVLESGKDVWSPLKLIDFGLSTHFTPGHRLSRVVGSSYYVAPEVLKKSYTEACDLWSLGVIVYMLLSGAPPFYGKNDEAIKASIVQGEYTFPHELFRDVSDDAMAFVSTLLSYNTEYRYTAEQALTHPWLKANLDPEQLQRAKDGARGIGPACSSDAGASEPMQI